MKIGTFLCNCAGSLKNIDWDELQSFMKEKTGSEGNGSLKASNGTGSGPPDTGSPYPKPFKRQENLPGCVYRNADPTESEAETQRERNCTSHIIFFDAF